MMGFKVFGDICLSQGMHQIGELDFQPFKLLSVGMQMIINPWLDLGVGLELGFFLLYLFALSWLDLSYLLPITASNYLLTSLLAAFLLHETIDVTRWMGILAVSIGVLLVGLSERKKLTAKTE
jgi:transporter family protein